MSGKAGVEKNISQNVFPRASMVALKASIRKLWGPLGEDSPGMLSTSVVSSTLMMGAGGVVHRATLGPGDHT